jgi:small subunit ribosomal protein S16
MLIIRLQRVGRKNDPSFRVVVTDSKNGPRSGRSLEVLGAYNPRRDEGTVLKADRIKRWMEHGAQVSPTVHNLLISKSIITGKKINVLPRKSPPAVAAEAAAEQKPEAVEAAPEAPATT